MKQLPFKKCRNTSNTKELIVMCISKHIVNGGKVQNVKKKFKQF